MNYFKNLSLCTIALVILSACVGTKTGAYRVFTDDLTRIVGQPLDEANIFNIGFLKEPTEITTLSNGNKRYQYDFEHAEINGSEQCIVFIELNPDDEIILNATSGGLGCWRVY